MAQIEDLKFEIDGPIATITMNRPEARNAWSRAMLVGLADAWEKFDTDPNLHVAILTGAGGIFCAGADLKMMHSGREQDPYAARFDADPKLWEKASLRIHRPMKPIIAAVERYALAGGIEILLGTDIRVAGQTAKFGLTEGAHGLFPLGGSTVRLVRQISFTNALDILLTARPIDATRAKAIGLIGHIVPDGEALAKGRALAQQIAANAPLSMQAIKRSVYETLNMDEAEGLAHEMEIGRKIIFETEDAREGTKAFKEKRRPNFKGR